MDFDVEALRSRFPALREGAAHLDGPGGTQTPVDVADAMRDAMTAAISNRGRATPAERYADDVVLGARAAAADLLGADPRGIVFGRSMTQLTFDLARALAKDWGPGDEVVVSRLDHDANVRPWVAAAESAGATLRWIDFDTTTGEMPLEAVTAVLSERTRLVAVTGASNLIGTRPPVAEISRLAHRAGALCYVDGVHLTAHAPVDVEELGADFYACSPYKFLGPHLGLVAARPETLDRIRPDKLLPATDAVPERFELGTLPYEMLAGTTAAIDFLAGLAPGDGPRRERLRVAMGLVERHEDDLRVELEAGLAGLDGIRLHSRARHRTPTLLMTFDRHDAAEARDFLAGRGVYAGAGDFYAREASLWLGLGEGGGLRAGLAPYSSRDDVERLLAALGDLLR